MSCVTTEPDTLDFGYPRHPEMWMDDGNLVLIADNRVTFRVHRSVVTRKSTVFNDMFSFPQPPDAPQSPGCVVIHLPDSPEDLFYFLDAIYDARKYCFSMEKKPTWPAVKALLLLGEKYDAEDLLEEAMLCLRRHYPKDIEEWDKLRKDYGSFIIGENDVLPIEIANLSRLLHLPEFHLSALYDCCRLPTGTLAHSALRGEASEQRARLDEDDVAACLAARKGLTDVLAANVEDLFEVTPCDIYDEFFCPTPHRCVPATQDVQYHHEKAQTDAIVADAGCSALEPLDARIASTFGAACERCVGFYQKRYAESRQELRNRLAKYIAVPPY
ncbi:uncharacterized protein PHACADRAFT_264852 [Phanerochaete carnosa HHB-10118-sp]|uniref:BTB domain-containing protein n=1 Tax=Phanerochaete carnosa (strain HHB-10118-sp) TaxID=650164 RepID=K5VUH3_PHACS|nr:uncharacterized protein PHACADRAFT_264852 [Phanerochaete carnosa HHB-10118-sp]EKM50234.1 hypothetical protein PHACADRAFT_264852 [Phanerochaete carnosa HHB-10118-sp]